VRREALTRRSPIAHLRSIGLPAKAARVGEREGQLDALVRFDAKSAQPLGRHFPLQAPGIGIVTPPLFSHSPLNSQSLYSFSDREPLRL
jgi:hypothetical protein